MKLLRSLLFVPGNNPKRIAKAMNLPADVVILDLEDACPISEKVASRKAVVEALQQPRRQLGYVRINALSTQYGYGDICAVVEHGVDGIVLTKVNSAEEVKTADWLMRQIEREKGFPNGSVDLIPLIETASGLANVSEITKASPRVKRLAFGAGDFTADLGIQWSREEVELLSFRSSLVVASRHAGIEPPIDLAWLNIKDDEGFGNSLTWARTLGFQGKLCIHPDQVGPVNEAFVPSEEEVARAQRVVSVFQKAESQGSAAVALDGAMIDYAVVVQAQRTIRTSEAIRRAMRSLN